MCATTPKSMCALGAVPGQRVNTFPTLFNICPSLSVLPGARGALSKRNTREGPGGNERGDGPMRPARVNVSAGRPFLSN